MFLILVLSVTAILRPLIVGNTIDNQIKNNDASSLLFWVLVYVGILLFEVFFSYLQVYLSNWIAQSVTLDLRGKLFKHVVRFKLRYFDQTPVGTFVTRLVSDVDGIAKVFSNGILTIMSDMLKLVFVVAYMFYTSWSLTILVLIPIPLLFYFTNVFQRVMKTAFVEIRNQVNKINVFVQEHITGMNIVQIFNREEREEAKFREINHKHMKAHIRTIWGFSVFFPIVELLSSFSIALLLWWGGLGSIEGDYSKGELITFSMYIFMLYRPIRQLADRFTVLQDGLVNGERVFKLMDQDQYIGDHGQIDKEKLVGDIAFENVSFAYNDEQQNEGEIEWVLKDLNFQVKKGETVAFVGATGAGKSSIINLIGRYYNFQKGKIHIDGQEIRDYTLSTIRKNVSVVLQDVFLSSDSILNNVTLYDKNVSREDVIESAKLIGAHDFIMSLPDQYDYEVGERGGRLSTGQRQLIAFMRACVHNPEILILDEATSSIDSESEELIQLATEKITEGRTSLIIAHRLSTISHVDRIYVMEQGEIVEQGTHQELLDKNGYYKRLYELQFADA